MRRIDLTGQHFGNLTAVRYIIKVGWECLCICGKHAIVPYGNLKSGNTKSCGCGKRLDLNGNKVGRLKVLGPGDKNSSGNLKWICKCDCGNIVQVSGSNLIRQDVRSCGCLQAERASESSTTHGMSKSRTYNVWSCLQNRVYSGREIPVCDRWRIFENFLEDMGEAPEGYSIERINPYEGYSPYNCEWILIRENTVDFNRGRLTRRGRRKMRRVADEGRRS
jgi:hypothetical protein